MSYNYFEGPKKGLQSKENPSTRKSWKRGMTKCGIFSAIKHNSHTVGQGVLMDSFTS
jgi:hypothetical protein